MVIDDGYQMAFGHIKSEEIKMQKSFISSLFTLGIAFLLFALLPKPAGASEPIKVTTSQLTLGTALKIANAAIAQCRKSGYEVSATVVNREGITQVALRDTLAPPISLKFSTEKAYTSAMFDAKGTDLQLQAKRLPLARAGAHLIFVGGSVPIEAGGEFYGAIGVSGTPNAKLDEECAAAGLNAVHDDLEMQ